MDDGPLWNLETEAVSTELVDEGDTLTLTLTTGAGRSARSISTEVTAGEAVELLDALSEWLRVP